MVGTTTRRSLHHFYRRDPARVLSREPTRCGWLLLGQRAGVGDRERGLAIVLGPDRRFDSWAPRRYRWVLNVQLSREGVMSSAVQLLDAAGRRRSPATLPEFHAGRAPGNKGQRYAADPPTVDEIIAVMRHADHARYAIASTG